MDGAYPGDSGHQAGITGLECQSDCIKRFLVKSAQTRRRRTSWVMLTYLPLTQKACVSLFLNVLYFTAQRQVLFILNGVG